MKVQRAQFVRSAPLAFSFAEVLIAVVVVGMVVVTLYTAFTQGTVMTRLARENQRATQILLEQCEALRLCGWSQITSNGGVPATFTAEYDPQHRDKGAIFNGSIAITNAPMNVAYQTNLKQVLIRVKWQTGSIQRQRELKTLVARYGLNTYVD